MLTATGSVACSTTAQRSSCRWTATSPTTRRRSVAGRSARRGRLRAGSRYVPGGGSRLAALRQAISKGGCLYARVVLGVPVRDFTGGFKAWRSGCSASAPPVDRRARVRLPGPDDYVRGSARRLSRPRGADHFPRSRARRFEDALRRVTEAAVMVPRLRRGASALTALRAAPQRAEVASTSRPDSHARSRGSPSRDLEEPRSVVAVTVAVRAASLTSAISPK